MTRGKFILITKNKVYISTEFNGDMYPDGRGVDVFKRLLRVENLTDLIMEVEAFNKANYNYEEEELIYDESLGWLKKARHFDKDYFENWFSDWLYIKNISGRDRVFYHSEGGEGTVVKDGQVVAFNFGRSPDEEDTKYFKKKLGGKYAQ